MKKKLDQGITLVVDRYAFSGVAFTSAKPVSVLWKPTSVCWCFHVSEEQRPGSLSSAGLLPGLVQATRRGPAQARPGDVPATEPGRGRTSRSVRQRTIRNKHFPGISAGEVWAAHEGSVGQLEGMEIIRCCWVIWVGSLCCWMWRCN